MGRVHGHRGLGGELTVRVAVGQAERWTAVRRVWIGPAEGEAPGARPYVVERSRAYRDRWVLKLAGIQDSTAAAALRGCIVSVERADAPPPAPGAWYAADLVGLAVFTAEDRRELGRVEDVLPTGGTDLLQVRCADGGELLIPLAGEIVREVQLAEGRLVVTLPEGLEQLGRSGPRAEGG